MKKEYIKLSKEKQSTVCESCKKVVQMSDFEGYYSIIKYKSILCVKCQSEVDKFKKISKKLFKNEKEFIKWADKYED